jgi:hypothetical protein
MWCGGRRCSRTVPRARRGRRAAAIALITFNWPRLTCPGLASRHAVVAGGIRHLQQRPRHGRGALRRRPSFAKGQTIERNGDGSQQVGGDLGTADIGAPLTNSEVARAWQQSTLSICGGRSWPYRSGIIRPLFDQLVGASPPQLM